MSFFKSLKDTIQANTNRITNQQPSSTGHSRSNSNNSNNSNSNPTSPPKDRRVIDTKIQDNKVNNELKQSTQQQQDNRIVIKSSTLPNDHDESNDEYIIEIWGNGKENGIRIDFTELYSKQRIVALSAGAIHTALITDAGLLYTWGDGILGRLGHGDQESYSHPKLVEQMSTYRVSSVSSGGKHTMALTDEGFLYSFGGNDSCQLGLGNSVHATFVALPSRVNVGERVIAISTGANRSAAISVEGNLYTWGRGEHGRLGHGDTMIQSAPKRVQTLHGHVVVDVSCGGGHTMALTEKGQVFSWGRGESGQLGHGSYQHQQVTPKMVFGLQEKSISKISCGGYHSIAIDTTGQMYAWGRSDYGVLGNGSDDGNHNTPLAIVSPVFADVSAGFQHNIAITPTQEVYSWGCGVGLRLGNKTEEHVNIPKKCLLDHYNPILISSGEIISIVIGKKLPFKLTNLDSTITTTTIQQDNNNNNSNNNIIVEPQEEEEKEKEIIKEKVIESNIIDDEDNQIFKRTSSPTPSFVSFSSDHLVGKDLLLSTQSNLINWLEKVNKSKLIINLIIQSRIKQQPPSTDGTAKELKETTQSIQSIVQLEQTDKQETLDRLVSTRNQSLSKLKQQLDIIIPFWKDNIQQKTDTNQKLINLLNQPKSSISSNSGVCGSRGEGQPIQSTSDIQSQCKLLLDRLDHSVESLCLNISTSINSNSFEGVRLSMEGIELIVHETIKYGDKFIEILDKQIAQMNGLLGTATNELESVTVQMEKIQSATSIFEDRERIKSEYRSCKRESIETSRKIEVLELEEDVNDQDSLSTFKDRMITLKKEEQRLLKKQQEMNEKVITIFEKYAPELKLKFNLQEKISNKVKDTGLLMSDRKFNQYDIIKTLASHPHNVYLASFDDQLVVLKEFGIGDQFGKQMFERQVSLMKMMNHKCIMQIQAVFYDRNAFIQMEYIKNGTMVEWLKHKGTSSSSSPNNDQHMIVNRKPWELQKIFQQIIQAISYMHTNGVIHRDLKLENVLIRDDDTPIISDFDLSKDISISNNNTTLFSGGTEIYRAPEMREGSNGSYATDIWAFGVMLYKAFFPRSKDPFLMPNESIISIPQHSDQNLINLLQSILQKNYNSRPTADQITVHPYFVTSQVESLLQSRALLDSREKMAALRAHVSSLISFSEDTNEPILLSIKRETLIQDVFLFFSKLAPTKLFSRLEVEFKGEKGLDHGGLQSEMYSIFFNDSLILNQIQQIDDQQQQHSTSSTPSTMEDKLKSIFSNKFKLFERGDTQFYMISNQEIDVESSPLYGLVKSEKEMFRTLGRIFLKAIIDGKPIPDAFPPTFFKFLLGNEKATLNDMEAFDPQMAQSFKKVLLLDDIQQYLSTTFEGLVENGENIPVTDGNKEEFIQKNIDRILVESRRYRLEQFRSGFRSIESLNAHFGLLSPSELQLLMCGSMMIDADLLKRHSKFVGFSTESKTPIYLLQVLDKMSQHELHLFLRFLTGMVVIPMNGLDKQLSIVMIPNSQKLPSAHTCTFQLNLPDYNDFEIIHTKIIQMLEWLESGFAFV